MPFKQISKATARQRFAAEQPIVLCPRILYPSYPFGSHSIINTASIQDYKVRAAWYCNDCVWKGSINETAWKLMYDNWCWHNASHEVGYYPHYYVEE